MNELLISEIKSEEKELLQKLILIEEAIFGDRVFSQKELSEVTHDTSLDILETIIKQCIAVIDEIESPLERAEFLLNELYFQHLFIDHIRPVWPLSSYNVANGLNNRLMSPMVKAAIVVEIITACGFDTDLVFVPNKIMVRVCCDEQYAIIFDAITGESLDWAELDTRLDELSGDPGNDNLKAVSDKIAIVEYLVSLKNALIREQAFDKALKCIDVILSLNPDDPILRRDRGYLLHQLDCFKVAVDDYRYFVEQCPQDPAAKILKIQLDKIEVDNTTLH
jgi:regulator of sirC expression with transglutaminase-like and TPR domain